MKTILLKTHPQLKISAGRVWAWTQRGGLILVTLLFLGAVYQLVATQLDRQKYPAPGQRVDVGGYRLHLNVMGEANSRPTVILNAGAGSMSSQWGWIQPELAKMTRVVAFDRAGLGWSDPAPAGVMADARTASEALYTALQQAGIEGPYILVGHSLGGGHARVFAGMYPDEVAGLVLLDAVHPEMWDHLTPEAVAENQAFVGRLKWLPLLARLGLMRFINPFEASGETLPEQQAAELNTFVATVPHLTAWQDEYLQLRPNMETMDQLRSATKPGEVPLLVISRGTPDDVFTQAQQLVDAKLVHLNSRGQHHLIPEADHFTLVTDRDHAHRIVGLIQKFLEGC